GFSGNEKVVKIDFPHFEREDWVICIALLLVVGLWITDRWHGLDPLVPAMIGLTLVLLLTKRLTWLQLKQSSALDLALIVATLFSLVDVLDAYGILETFGYYLHSLYGWIGAFGSFGVMGLVILLTILFNLFIPSIPVCTTFLIPLFMSGFAGTGFNPLFVALTVTMVVDTVKFYPAQSTPLLLAYEKKRFTRKDVALFGFIMAGLIFIIVPGIVLSYWRFLEG
ncbi:MAG TPA: anion permease, partial [Bacillales bacterium]